MDHLGVKYDADKHAYTKVLVFADAFLTSSAVIKKSISKQMYLSFPLEQSTRNENQDEERVQLCLKLQNQVWEMEVSSFVWLFSFNQLPI